MRRIQYIRIATHLQTTISSFTLSPSALSQYTQHTFTLTLSTSYVSSTLLHTQTQTTVNHAFHPTHRARHPRHCRSRYYGSPSTREQRHRSQRRSPQHSPGENHLLHDVKAGLGLRPGHLPLERVQGQWQGQLRLEKRKRQAPIRLQQLQVRKARLEVGILGSSGFEKGLETSGAWRRG